MGLVSPFDVLVYLLFGERVGRKTFSYIIYFLGDRVEIYIVFYSLRILLKSPNIHIFYFLIKIPQKGS